MEKKSGWTFEQIALLTNKSYNAARQLILRAKIKPVCKDYLWPDEALELVKNAPGPGWTKGRKRGPKKKKEPKE